MCFVKSVETMSANLKYGKYEVDFAKLRALLSHVPTCLVCLPAHVPKCLACLRTYVPTFLACLCAQMLTCLACLRAHVRYELMPTFLPCLRAHVLKLQITTISFQWHVFLRFLVLFLCLFPVKWNCRWKVHDKLGYL